MSPVIFLVFLVVLFGLGIFMWGIVRRRKRLLLLGAPAPLLLIAWLVAASMPPSATGEFDRIFGEQHRSIVSDVETLKPTSMDGFFFSFRIESEEFERRIRPMFEPTDFTNFDLLRGQRLPAGWPQSIETLSSALAREVDYHDVLITYDATSSHVYGSVRYDQW